MSPLIDAHHHIWRLDDLAWLSGPMQPRIFGTYEKVRRDYLIDEYLADIARAGVVKSVYVQTNWPPGGALREVEWVQSVADAHGFPHAIVGFADLAAPDLPALIKAQRRSRNFRGLRQQLFWHDNPAYRFAPRPDLMNDPDWRRGLAAVADSGLLFELQVFAPQMRDTLDLVRAYPGLQFVLVHAGMMEDPTRWTAWREGMARLSEAPNVAVKLSGLNTFVRTLDAGLTARIVGETVALFGADRCMFGSNFPIEKMWTDFDSLVAALDTAIAPLPEAARRAVRHDTAAKLYGLG